MEVFKVSIFGLMKFATNNGITHSIWECSKLISVTEYKGLFTFTHFTIALNILTTHPVPIDNDNTFTITSWHFWRDKNFFNIRNVWFPVLLIVRQCIDCRHSACLLNSHQSITVTKIIGFNVLWTFLLKLFAFLLQLNSGNNVTHMLASSQLTKQG